MFTEQKGQTPKKIKQIAQLILPHRLTQILFPKNL